MNPSALWGSLRIASVLLILAPLPVIGQETSGHAGSAGNDLTTPVDDLPAVLLDAQLMDAKRQLDVLNTLRDISTALREVRPYRQSLLFLLDPKVPVDERWRLALQSVPIPDREPDSESAGDGFETQILRQELESLRAEISILQSLPDIIQPDPEPSHEPVAVEPPAVKDEWLIGGDSIRYVQFAGDGVEPSIWLSSASGGVRIGKGQSVSHAGRTVRLVSLQRRPDGRIRINLRVDGEPVRIVR